MGWSLIKSLASRSWYVGVTVLAARVVGSSAAARALSAFHPSEAP